MASIVSIGFDQLEKELLTMADSSGRIAKAALYDGADFMADKLRAATENLQVEDRRRKRSKNVLDYEKEALLNGLAIEKFRDDRARDCVQTSITFHGYSDHETEDYPGGVPAIILARAIIAGTVFRVKNRFFPNAFNRNKKEAEMIMVKKAESEMQKILK